MQTVEEYYQSLYNLINATLCDYLSIDHTDYQKVVVDCENSLIFSGWDLDGDGEPDCVPVTSTKNIVARAVRRLEKSMGVHEYGIWKMVQAPTCTENGEEQRSCRNCNHCETRIIEALGHNFDTEWTIDVEQDCTHTGIKSHHCLNEGCSERSDITVIPISVPRQDFFRSDIAVLCETVTLKDQFQAIKRAITTYRQMTEDEKAQVEPEYEKLCEIVDKYNAEICEYNGIADEVTHFAWMPFALVYLLLPMAWHLIKKEFEM